MAPESPGNLIVLDLRRKDTQLVCQVERYDSGKDFLYVSWDALECPENYVPVAGGVAFVWVPKGYKHRKYPAQVNVTDGVCRWRDTAENSGAMLIQILPPNQIFIPIRNFALFPIEFKATKDGRMALYWWLEKGRFEVKWRTKYALDADITLECHKLNRSASRRKKPTATPVHIDRSPEEKSIPSHQPPVLHQPPDAVLIVTVNKNEVQAVLDVFCGMDRVVRTIVGGKTYYELGVYDNLPVFMVQSEMGSATPGGAIVTVMQSAQNFHLQSVIMCGIAFGLRPDKQQLGDILIARQIVSYEPQKVTEGSRLMRGDRVTASEQLLDRFRSGDNTWGGARSHFGLMVSGEKLVNDPNLRNWLLDVEPEAIGGEMEGAGLYVAARNKNMDWILVKGISDWADGTKNDEAQHVAARNAAQFVKYVLEIGG